MEEEEVTIPLIVHLMKKEEITPERMFVITTVMTAEDHGLGPMGQVIVEHLQSLVLFFTGALLNYLLI